MDPLKIVMITTSHEQLGETGRKTGLWLESLATPYYWFKDAGARITIASIKGGDVPLDPKSESLIVATSQTKKFLKDPEALSSLSHSVNVAGLQASDFDGVLLTGGHGALWDFPTSAPLHLFLNDFIRQQRPLAAIGHGAVALLPLHDDMGGTFLMGRKLTAFSNSEEESSRLTDVVPFLLETKLSEMGVVYSKGPLYTSHTVVDGNLITGQNPGSAGAISTRLLALMKENAGKAVVA